MKPSRNVLSFLVLFALSACSDPSLPLVCTDAGCESGLWVRLDRPLPDGTLLSLDIGTGPAWNVVCGQDADCEDGIFFSGLVTNWVGITVSDESAAHFSEHRPDYSDFYPNGEDCEPVCATAEIEVAVPTVD